MKLIIAVVLLVITSLCFAQNSDTISKKITLDYRPAKIHLFKDKSEVTSSESIPFTTKTFKGFAGCYQIYVSGITQNLAFKDSVCLEAGQILKLLLVFNGPCLYDHPKDYVPICPKNHKDHIVPIIYGLLAERVNQAQKTPEEKGYYVGGCVVSDCDPHFYCVLHDIRF